MIAKNTSFEATLGSKNGIPEREYEFRIVQSHRNSGNFADVMIQQCASISVGSGWKPVCDHPFYCKKDLKSIYIGQTHHIAFADTTFSFFFFQLKPLHQLALHLKNDPQKLLPSLQQHSRQSHQRLNLLKPGPQQVCLLILSNCNLSAHGTAVTKD